MINLWTSPEINTPDFYHYDLLRQLSAVLGVTPRVDHKAGGTGVHVFMVLARWLFVNQDWFRSLNGPKIVVEHDAYLNFMPESPYHHCWTRLYRNCNFDLIISSGKRTTERLRDEGLPAVWVPKGTNAEFLDAPPPPVGAPLGYFSCPVAEQETGTRFYYYRSRHAMSDRMRGWLEPIACPAGEFPTTVSRYGAVVTDDATMGEVMAKQFECSALGCLVIRDRQDELLDLGFEDGKSVMFYESLDHLEEIVGDLQSSPDLVAEMGGEARRIAARHTWRHRAEEIYRWVKPYVTARIHI